MLTIILFIEPSILVYTKEMIDNILFQYGSKCAAFSKLMHCICIFAMPIIAKSPLTMLPLLGLVISLLLIFYKGHEYKNVIYVPEITVVVGVLTYMFLKVKTIGYYTPVISSFSTFFCSYNDSPKADTMSKVYVLLSILAMVFFKLFRYFTYIVEIQSRQSFMKSMGSFIEGVGKNKVSPLMKPIKEEVKEEDPEQIETDKKDQDINIDLKGKDLIESIVIKSIKGDNLSSDIHSETAKYGKDPDYFKSYFCRNFDSILRINRNAALGLEKDIVDPIVLELRRYIKMSKLQEKWSQAKTYSTKEKIMLKMLAAGRWIAKAAKYVYFELLVSFFKNFFLNQYIVMFIETMIAILFVVYSRPTFTIYPIMIWIFINVYPRYSGYWAIQFKIWLLMVPTGITSLIAKNRVNQDAQSTNNPDFNFSYQEEYKIIDISTMGVLLMAFVILEMILMTSYRQKSNNKNLLEGEVHDDSAGVTNKLFVAIMSVIIDNAIYIIMINIYLIALDINIINLGLIVFFIKMILSRRLSEKTIYLLFWFNQISIFIKYLYSHLKELNGGIANDSNPSDPSKPSPLSFYKMIGLEESDNMSAKVRLLLNFGLQLLLIFLIFKIRNPELFKKLKQEETKSKLKKGFALTGFRLTLFNLGELMNYSLFHCIPWLSYLVIYLSMIFTSTTVVTACELIFLCYIFVKHVRISIDQRFGGLNIIKHTWRTMIFFSSIMALGRYILWFSTLEYIKKSSDWVNNFNNFITLRLNFIGLIPRNLSEAYLELLPSFLSMYLGSFIIERAKDVKYYFENEKQILDLDVDDATEPVIDIAANEAAEGNHRFSLFQNNVPNVVQPNDLRTRLTENELREIEQKDKMIRIRKTVLGDINFFKGVGEKTMHFYLKFFMIINFVLTVYFSTRFRVGIAMFVLLVINLMYFWKCHTVFINAAEEQKLDQQILIRRVILTRLERIL